MRAATHLLALSLVGLPLMGCQAIADHYGAAADPSDATEHIFEVPSGTTPRGLGAHLERAGIVSSADDFTMYVRVTREGGCLKAGRFGLKRSMSAGEILSTVCGVPLADEEPFAVIEGWRIREIDAALAEKGWITAGEYAAAATDPSRFTARFTLPTDTLEGYLFPETYMVEPDRWDTEGFIQRQLDLLAERFATPRSEEISGGSRSLADVVIMASLLEREEPSKPNRPLVAGILWKRLDDRWHLGVDATSRYTLAKWNDRGAFLKKLRDPKDPYNTRLRPGLPPTPIGSPGLASLEAALAPTESEFWFYLHDSKGKIHPSRNQREHEAYRRKYNVY